MASCLAALIGASQSCTKTTTQVMVRVVAEGTLADRAERLQITVTSSDGEETDAGYELGGLDLSDPRDAFRIPLVPAEGNADRTYVITVQLVDGAENLLGTQTVSGSYAVGQFREVWVVFEESCTGTDVACPEGSRCYEGQCVERCVAAAPAGTTTKSEPVPCEDACEASACAEIDADGELQAWALGCDPDGYRVFMRQCGFGCGFEECQAIEPSNVGHVLTPQSGFGSLVVGAQMSTMVVLDTDDGSIEEIDGTGEVVAEIRPPGEVGTVANGVGFEWVDEPEDPSCTDGQDPTREPEHPGYGVFSVEALAVHAGSLVSTTGTRALVILANADVEIDGTVSAAATATSPGPGGFAGGDGADSSGHGPGGGLTGSSNGAGTVHSGAGGGAHGSRGGPGGWMFIAPPTAAEPIAPGGSGCRYGAASLEPLVGGSGGGGGWVGAGAPGGHGGGAIQISTNGRIFVRASGLVTVAGGGGIGRANDSGGSGGGAGGSVLFEAGEVRFVGGSPDLARVGAPGGGGGGASTRGGDGDLRAVPAVGGPSSTGGATVDELVELLASGGAGSTHDAGSTAEGGQRPSSDAGGFGWWGGGGGGGAGRVRINTAAGASDRDALKDFITPRSAALFTVGEARLK